LYLDLAIINFTRCRNIVTFQHFAIYEGIQYLKRLAFYVKQVMLY